MDDRAADQIPPAGGPTLYGARWASILGAALLIALALIAAVRWFGGPAASAEQIIQVPPPAFTPKLLPPPELLAPDPGDTP